MAQVTVVKLAGLSRHERDALLQRSAADLTGFFDTVRPIIAAVKAEVMWPWRATVQRLMVLWACGLTRSKPALRNLTQPLPRLTPT